MYQEPNKLPRKAKRSTTESYLYGNQTSEEAIQWSKQNALSSDERKKPNICGIPYY